MSKQRKILHRTIKKLLGYNERTPSKKILVEWRRRTREVCKPCWELKYCPYGPLVEDFPLPLMTRAEVNQHNEYLKNCLSTGQFSDGTKLDRARRKYIRTMVRDYDPQQFPPFYPQFVLDVSCRVFGHICPVFFISEALTETKDRRKHTRSIPRDVMLKVIRRDG